VTMRSSYWLFGACAGGFLLVACAAGQEKAETPSNTPATDSSDSGPVPPGNDMEVGMKFDEGEAPAEAEEEEGSHEPPPTQTYSPANKLSPEEKAAAKAKE
jgi:hypothetical protein